MRVYGNTNIQASRARRKSKDDGRFGRDGKGDIGEAMTVLRQPMGAVRGERATIASEHRLVGAKKLPIDAVPWDGKGDIPR